LAQSSSRIPLSKKEFTIIIAGSKEKGCTLYRTPIELLLPNSRLIIVINLLIVLLNIGTY